MADANDRPSLVPLLAAVQQRPGKFLGAAETDFGLLLERLDAFIIGYREAVFRHSMDDAGLDAFSRFKDYVGRQHWWNVSEGVIRTHPPRGAVRRGGLGDVLAALVGVPGQREAR